MDSSRPWISTSGKEGRRKTTLSFVLPRAMKVRFTVKKLAPVCRIVGRFTVQGHEGLNRIRFGPRIGGRPLVPGTYEVTARTRDGRSLRRLIIVGGAPTRGELAALRAANACFSARGIASSTGASNRAAVSDTDEDGSFPASGQRSTSGPQSGPSPDSGGVLGSATVEKAAHALQPALIALLAASILLLGLASVPKFAGVDPRINDALARNRPELAALGAAALVAVIITFLLG